MKSYIGLYLFSNSVPKGDPLAFVLQILNMPRIHGPVFEKVCATITQKT